MSICKEIRYWTSHPNKGAAWWLASLGINSKYFNLIYDPVSPDYLFATEQIYTEWRARSEFRRLYSPNRIVLFWAGECISPDMNIFDYATTFDRGMVLADRIIRRPIVKFFGAFNKEPLNVFRMVGDSVLSSKVKFCNFIYTNANAHPCRDALFYSLSKYKMVDSLGRHLKNCASVDTRDAIDFEAKSVEMKRPYKFSIAAENATFKGYASEKILTSYLACTVPIYWGDPCIGIEFNEKAFINANKLDEKDLIEIVRAVDTDDRLWKEMVSQPLLTEAQYERMLMEEAQYCRFMEELFNRPLESALRKPQGFWSDNYRRTFFAAKARPAGGAGLLHRVCSSWIQMIRK